MRVLLEQKKRGRTDTPVGEIFRYRCGSSLIVSGHRTSATSVEPSSVTERSSGLTLRRPVVTFEKRREMREGGEIRCSGSILSTMR